MTHLTILTITNEVNRGRMERTGDSRGQEALPHDPGFRVSGVYPDGEIGTAMFGTHNVETGVEEPGPRELVRLAIPRRVYTQSHVDYIVEVVEEAFRRREGLKPFRFLEQAPFLRHFTARYGVVE
jgi:tryptophanase